MKRRMRRQTLSFDERLRQSRERSERAAQQQCRDCGRMCPTLRGNPGEYGKCTHCGGSPGPLIGALR